MYPHLNLGHNIELPLYNLFVGIGIIFGLLYLDNLIRIRKINFITDKKIYISLIISIIVGFLGAKIFDLIYLDKSINLINLYSGGTTFMGGVITASIIFLLINLLLKTSNLLAFNLLTPSLIIAHFFGRIGCFLGGCCYGTHTETLFGVKYPEEAPASVHLGANMYSHPTQLYESFSLILLLIIVEKYTSFENKIFIYLAGYGLLRFFIEFLRLDERGHFITNLISPSQFMCIVFFLLGTTTILVKYYFSKESTASNNF